MPCLKATVAKFEDPDRFVKGLAEEIMVSGDVEFIQYLKIKIKVYNNLVEDFAQKELEKLFTRITKHN